MLLSGTISEDCMRIRQQSPLIHNITNYVAMSLSANALLAIGASPLMSSEPEEMQDIVSKAEALTVNIGCLEGLQLEAMRLAAEAAYIQGKLPLNAPGSFAVRFIDILASIAPETVSKELRYEERTA